MPHAEGVCTLGSSQLFKRQKTVGLRVTKRTAVGNIKAAQPRHAHVRQATVEMVLPVLTPMVVPLFHASLMSAALTRLHRQQDLVVLPAQPAIQAMESHASTQMPVRCLHAFLVSYASI